MEALMMGMPDSDREILRHISSDSQKNPMVLKKIIMDALHEMELDPSLELTVTLTKPLLNTVNSALIDPDFRLPNGSINVDFLLSSADVLEANREFDLAKNIYQSLVESGEAKAAALRGLARCFWENGNKTDGILAIEDSIAYESSIDSYLLYIRYATELGLDQKAVSAIERTLKMTALDEAERVELYLTLGNLYYKQSRYEKAISCYDSALNLDGNNRKLLLNIGLCLIKANQLKRAYEIFVKSSELYPDASESWQGLGSVCVQLGKADHAIQHFEASLDRDPQNAVSLLNLVKISYESKSFERAKIWLRRANELSPNNVHIQYSLAGVEFHDGDLVGARKSCARVLALQGDHKGARQLLSRMDHSVSQGGGIHG